MKILRREVGGQGGMWNSEELESWSLRFGVWSAGGLTQFNHGRVQPLQYTVANSFLAAVYADYMRAADVPGWNCPSAFYTPDTLTSFSRSQVSFSITIWVQPVFNTLWRLHSGLYSWPCRQNLVSQLLRWSHSNLSQLRVICGLGFGFPLWHSCLGHLFQFHHLLFWSFLYTGNDMISHLLELNALHIARIPSLQIIAFYLLALPWRMKMIVQYLVNISHHVWPPTTPRIDKST